jgi:hypothetical protein
MSFKSAIRRSDTERYSLYEELRSDPAIHCRSAGTGTRTIHSGSRLHCAKRYAVEEFEDRYRDGASISEGGDILSGKVMDCAVDTKYGSRLGESLLK